MPTIDFIYFDAGGGHRSAATALKAVIDSQNREWNVRLVNLQEVLEPMDVFKKLTGIKLEDIYNKLLAKGWTLGSAEMLKFMHAVIRVYHGVIVKNLRKHWEATRPDMVVSLVPNFNRVMFESLKSVLPKVPYVTILTDMADFPPHFWIEPRQDQYFICGTGRAVEQARSVGHLENRIYRASGMILRPMFYNVPPIDREAERRKLGFDPDKPVGLVLFGGQGSRAMLGIAQSLKDMQLILICGRNEALAAKLRQQSAGLPHFVEGFTSQVPYYMQVSDFMIGKPGPGSISEAIAMRLPVIVERNAWTLPQERFNTEWVVKQEAGIVVRNFAEIASAAASLTASLDTYRANAAKIENRAVFEIPDFLANILSKA